MTRIGTLALTVLATGFALPALADNDQLARSLNLPTGVYSTAELSLLRQAREDNDTLLERRILERADDARVSLLSDPSVGGAAPDFPVTPSS